jgi:hypothetical protein
MKNYQKLIEKVLSVDLIRGTIMNDQKKLFYYYLFIIIMTFPIGLAHPPEDDVCSSCHTEGGYAISTNSPDKLYMPPNSSFRIQINALGQGVEVWAHPLARDNQDFKFSPTVVVTDNDTFDCNNETNKISITFNISCPIENGTYTLLIFARSPELDPTELVFLEFSVVIDPKYSDPVNIPEDQVNWVQWITKHLFNHLNIYIGGTALLLLTFGTVLLEIDSKYIKIHGRLAAVAFFLTTFNIYFTFNESWTLIVNWYSGVSIEWGHLTHIFIGTLGYIVALIGFLQGLAGHDMKKLGYTALSCWMFNFIFGILYWGLGV